MSNIKPSDHGIVVENKESGLRYASLDQNFDPKSERKVRDLKAGESIMSYGIKPARPSFQPVGAEDDSVAEEADEEQDSNSGDNTLAGLEASPGQ